MRSRVIRARLREMKGGVQGLAFCGHDAVTVDHGLDRVSLT